MTKPFTLKTKKKFKKSWQWKTQSNQKLNWTVKCTV